jgi:hypothetical protein
MSSSNGEVDDYGNPFKTLADYGDPSRIDPLVLDIKYKRGGPSQLRKIYSKKSVDKLEALGFDPIEAMVNRYHAVDAIIQQMLNGPRSPSQVALANMITIQQKIANDLMKYAYAQIPDEDKSDGRTPTRIILTDEDSGKTTTIEVNKEEQVKVTSTE